MIIISVGICLSWGNNAYGQLGIGVCSVKNGGCLYHQDIQNDQTIENYCSSKINMVKIGLHIQIVKVATGERHTLAIDHEGNVYGWGFGNLGQLGIRSFRNQNTSSSITCKPICLKLNVMHALYVINN